MGVGVGVGVGVEPLLIVSEAGDCTRLFTVIPHDQHRLAMRDGISALPVPRRGGELRVYHRRSTLVRV